VRCTGISGGTWNRDGVIVFATTGGAALKKVSASGGVATAATSLAEGYGAHWRPSFLPDGRHFFYRVATGGIYVGSLDSPERMLIIKDPDNNNVLYSQGHLLFLRDRTLMAQPFDVNRLALTGEPVPVAEQIQTTGFPPSAIFSVSGQASSPISQQRPKAARNWSRSIAQARHPFEPSQRSGNVWRPRIVA
jgi:eukaryotic-like serine/threonine-protein kinase